MPTTSIHDIAERGRSNIVKLVERMEQEEDAVVIRDLAIGITVLSEAVEKLDSLANRESIHRSVLKRWQESIQKLLGEIAGVSGDDLKWHQYNEAVIIDRGEGVPVAISGGAYYGVKEGILMELEDRLYDYKPDQ